MSKTPNFYGINSLRKKEDKTPPKTLLKEFLLQFEKNLLQLDSGEKSKIIKEWTKRASGIGKRITINTSNGKIWLHDLEQTFDDKTIIPLLDWEMVDSFKTHIKDEVPYGICTDYPYML